MADRGGGRARGRTDRGGGRAGGGGGGRGHAGGRGGGPPRGGGGHRGEWSSGGGQGHGRGDSSGDAGYHGRGGRGARGDRGGSRGNRSGSSGGSAPHSQEVFSYGSAPKPQPDPKVKDHETKIMEQMLGRTKQPPSPKSPSPLPLSELALEERLPRRPGFGTGGRAVVLWANYFELNTDLDTSLHRYSIAVRPAAVGKKLEQITRLLLEEEAAFVARKNDIASDFRSTIVTRAKLGDDCLGDFEVTYRSEFEDEAKPSATTYTVRIQDSNMTHSMRQLVEYMTSTNLNAAYADRLPTIQAFNIIVGDYAKRQKNMVVTGTSKCFTILPVDTQGELGDTLVALRGFFSSVRLATSRILVNVNVANGAFYPSHMLLSELMRFRYQMTKNILPFIKGLKVYTTHLKPKTKNGQQIFRVKTICGFALPGDGRALSHPPKVEGGRGANQVQFWLEGGGPGGPSKSTKKKGKGKAASEPGPSSGPLSGRYISIAAFFKEAHELSLDSPNAPVVNVGTRENPSYLPPECCNVMPGQPYNKKLTPSETAYMINFAVRPPHKNAKSITEDGAKTVGLTQAPDSRLPCFKMSISPQLITVPGRVLKGLPIQYKGKGNNPELIFPSNGGWNMKNIKFMDAKALTRWGYVLICAPNRDAPWLHDQMMRFKKGLAAVGMGVAEPSLREKVHIETGKWQDQRVEEVFKLAQSRRVTYLFIILPDKGAQLYNHLKRLGDREYGIHTTCFDINNLRKQLDANFQPQHFKEAGFFANIALKVNLKLGGVNQSLEAGRLSILKDDTTMFVGIDVTHPSPGSAGNAPSVAAVVANVDRHLSQWPADLCIQVRRREEMVSSKLKDMFRGRLKKWISLGKHKTYPENILIYRDGVSEGQYNLVLEHELPQIRAACAELYSKPDQEKGLPRITIAVVGKRHHTRFYPTSSEDSQGKAMNCLPGTVVDRGVTEARNWDFYLQAHAAIQGTARPAHYQVILDEIFTGSNPEKPKGNLQARLEQTGHSQADVFEELTLAMSQIFGRATKVVSYATPARYADMVCERARAYLSERFDPYSSDGTPAASTTGGSSESEALGDETLLVHEQLRDTMFYV